MSLRRILALVLALLLTFGAAGALAAESNGKKAVKITKSVFPDSSFCKYVKKNIDTNNDGKLSSKEIKAVYTLDLSEMNIGNLKGIELFTNLMVLDCHGNKLKKLDVSKNSKLMGLSCFSNKLTKITLGKKKDLQLFGCFDNPKLKSVDIKDCPKLRALFKTGALSKKPAGYMWMGDDETQMLVIGLKCKLTAGKKVLFKP